MRGTTQMCPPRRAGVLLLLLALTTLACGGRSASSTTPDDAAPLADASQDDAAETQDAGPTIVKAWLATGVVYIQGLHPPYNPFPMRGPTGVLEANFGGEPPEGRIIFLFRLREVGASAAEITYGLGEPATDLPGEAYRFRTDPPPSVLLGSRRVWGDAGAPDLKDYATDQVAPALSFPLTPGAPDAPFVFTVESAVGSAGMVVNASTWDDQAVFHIEGGGVTAMGLCPVWLDGWNMLDVYDGLPTLGIAGYDWSSVDYATCDSWGDNAQDWYQLDEFSINRFRQVDLAVD
jgi:hypothetical protein